VPLKPEIEDILAALGDKYSIRMFRQASKGLIGGQSAPGEMGLSKKQFYQRLNKLLKMGLITKSEGLYRHTALGTLVHNVQIRPLEDALANYWNLKVIDELKQSGSIPKQEQERVAESLLSMSSHKALFIHENVCPSKVLVTYDELVKEILRLIQLAKRDIFIASRYFEPTVSLRLMDKVREGVALHILDGNSSGTSLVSRLQAALDDPAVRSLAEKALRSSKVRVRNSTVDYSLIVGDGG
jgi:predicted transcriptional regulator